MDNVMMLCKICLAQDCRMNFVNKNLQEVYEKLTAMPFQKVSRPLQVCYMCYARLKNCYRLQINCLRSEQLLSEMLLKKEFKPTPLQVENILKIVHQPAIDLSCATVTPQPLCHDVKLDDNNIKLEPSEFVQVKEEIIKDTEDNMDQEPSTQCTGIVNIKTENISTSDDNAYDSGESSDDSANETIEDSSKVDVELNLRKFSKELEVNISPKPVEIELKMDLDYFKTSNDLNTKSYLRPDDQQCSSNQDDAIKEQINTQENYDTESLIQEWRHSRNKEERKKDAERARLRYIKKHGIKTKVAKSGAERIREMRARKQLLQTVSDQRSEDEQTIDLSLPDILTERKSIDESLLQQKSIGSIGKYMVAYDTFIKWKTSKNAQSFSENVFLEYFNELAIKYKPTSLWCIYSMLKSTVNDKHGIDIKHYGNLIDFLKKRSDGYLSQKSKELLPEHVEKFLKEAPDCMYLATKVALIFGINGACRRQELQNITIHDVETHGNILLVKITNTTSKPRSFTIQGPYYDIVKKYQDLRCTQSKNPRFFQNYQKGKCTTQPIGVNKFGAMPKNIAKFLGLPDADLYTGHSFRRTSATILAGSGADIMTLKRHGRWRSTAAAESYAEESIQNKAEIISSKTEEMQLEPVPTTSASTYVDIDTVFIK